MRLLCDDDGAASAARPPPAAMPIWKRQRGVKRILGEVLDLQRQVARLSSRSCRGVRFLDDDAPERRALRRGDSTTRAGRPPAQDLGPAALARSPARARGQAHITMEIRFPARVPGPAARVRCVDAALVWYTGHVTAAARSAPRRVTHRARPAWTPDT